MGTRPCAEEYRKERALNDVEWPPVIRLIDLALKGGIGIAHLLSSKIR